MTQEEGLGQGGGAVTAASVPVILEEPGESVTSGTEIRLKPYLQPDRERVQKGVLSPRVAANTSSGSASLHNSSFQADMIRLNLLRTVCMKTGFSAT